MVRGGAWPGTIAEGCIVGTPPPSRAPLSPFQSPSLSTDPLIPPRVAALVVTWNRREALERCLRSVAAQGYPADRLDVVVVDNASTDGTAERVIERWGPDRVVHNGATEADVPMFALGRGGGGPGSGSWRSLTLVRNEHNLGGCGGFNTALLIVERMIAAHRLESMVPEDPRLAPAEPLEFVWLIDDDAEPAPDCLEKLVEAAASDPAIGIVGSRMVDPTDRRTTLESAVYFNASTGLFGPPGPDHPRREEHRAWLERVGSAKGRHESAAAQRGMAGVLDVECVAACSMLARWAVAREVGYWDARFFIAGDDADWCLRFLRAGRRVVCCLDAVVYHLPWSRKQTVMQDYYRRRNLLWIWERSLPEAALRPLARRRIGLIMRQAWEACWCGRSLDREIIRRSAVDAATGRGGRLDVSHHRAARVLDLAEALRSVGADRPGARLAVVCPTRRILREALRLRSRVRRLGLSPGWVLVASSDAVGARLLERLEGRAAPGGARGPGRAVGGAGGAEDIRLVRYGPRLRSKLKRQMECVLRPPSAWVMIDGRSDLPLVRCARMLHVETRLPGKARSERAWPGSRLWFAARWAWGWVRCRAYLARLRPRPFVGKFGTAPAGRA